jgi:hypothetical protein
LVCSMAILVSSMAILVSSMVIFVAEQSSSPQNAHKFLI